MEDILVSVFLKILNMSMTASYIILAVIIARLLLRRAPKKYSYALWAVALFRLICPVSFKSVLSIFSLKPFDIRLEDTALSSQTAQIVHIPENIGMMAQPEIQTGLPAVNAVVNESLPAATPMYSANPMQIWEYFGMLLWVTGIAVLLIVSLISLWRLCRRLRTATLLEGNVWQSENVQSPFIIGLFRPKIYIPYGLTEPALGYVLTHERAHIRRLDHVVRTLAYLVLCIHWFNPLVWLAFYLMGRDMELSCDEKVLSKMGDKAEYSETLLSFASPRRFPAPTPLAFGESSVGRRIKNALKWKRPRLWVSIIALLLCVTVIAACAANPKTEDDGWELSGRWVPVECVYQSPVYSYFPFGGDNGYIYEFHGEGDGLRIYDHQSGAFLGGFGPVWEWEEFPYSDEEWAEMFILYENAFGQPISELYDEILYIGAGPDLHSLPITEGDEEVFWSKNSFLMSVDGELWFVSTTKDTSDKQWVSSIYALQKEEELGKAEFIYPDGTSNEPGMEIEFPDGVESVYAFCDEGSVGLYVMGELFSWADGSITVPGLDSLFWCPVQNGSDYQRPQPYGLAENDRIQLVVHFDDLSSLRCSIYVDYNDGTYTLRPVGKGVYLSQTGEGKALLSFDRSYAYPDSTATDIPVEIPAGSPWELLTGLVADKDSIYMLEGGGFDHGERAREQINRILTALEKLSPDELKVGRGAPWVSSLGFQIPSGDLITLGYCGDFVELQLSEGLRELYPAEGGVWEIHNTALTELLGSGELGEFAGLELDSAEELEIVFDIPGMDMVSYSWDKWCPASDNTINSSHFSGEIFEEDGGLVWTNSLEVDGIACPIEYGTISFTVCRDTEYIQGSLSFECTQNGESMHCEVEAGGSLAARLDESSGEIIVTAAGDFRPSIYEFTSRLYGKDVEVIGVNPTELSERLPNDMNRRAADALRGVKASEIGIGSVIFQVELALKTPEGTLSLLYDGEKAMLDFDSELEEKYGGIRGSWVIDSPELRALFDGILPNEDDYQIISGNIRQLKKAWIERDGIEVSLGDDNVDGLLAALAAGEKRVELYPSHIGSMQDSTYCTIVLEYDDGNMDEIVLGSESGCFFRFTGTYGSGNDRGFVQVFSDEAREYIDELLG